MKFLIPVLLIILLCAVCMTSCIQGSGPGKITEDDLANLEYKIEITAGGKAKLENGSYSEEAAPGSASKIEVALTENMVFGDLDSNGIEDAAVILTASGGGSGTFYYIAAVINKIEGLESSNSIFLGDRVEIKNILIDSGLITVEYLDRTLEQSFAEDPTMEVIREFKVQDNNLTLVSQTMALGEESISVSLATQGLLIPCNSI